MFKLVVFFTLVAIAAARPGLIAPLTYAAVPLDNSGYAYTHSVQTPDYANHVSVNKPLITGTTLVNTLPAVHARTIVSAPLVAPGLTTYAAASPLVHAWQWRTKASGGPGR